MSIEQVVIEKLKMLPTNKQQEVLDFIEFLQAKTQTQDLQLTDATPMSVKEVAKEFAGCLDGRSIDLSARY